MCVSRSVALLLVHAHKACPLQNFCVNLHERYSKNDLGINYFLRMNQRPKLKLKGFFGILYYCATVFEYLLKKKKNRIK